MPDKVSGPPQKRHERSEEAATGRTGQDSKVQKSVDPILGMMKSEKFQQELKQTTPDYKEGILKTILIIEDNDQKVEALNLFYKYAGIENPLQSAITNSDEDSVLKLIDLGKIIISPEEHLLQAIQENKEKIALKIIEKCGNELNKCQSILKVALEKKQDSVALELIKLGVAKDVKQWDKISPHESPFVLALLSGCDKAVLELIKVVSGKEIDKILKGRYSEKHKFKSFFEKKQVAGVHFI